MTPSPSRKVFAVFTFADTPVKFVGLLLLFVFCTGWSLYELSRKQDTTQRISNVLHLVMSLVMLLMVSKVTWAPVRTSGAGPLLIALFVASVLWFLVLAVTRTGARLHFVGHALMFGAMAWHLVGMQVKMAGRQHGTGGMQHGTEGMGQAPMPQPMVAQPGEPMWIVAVVGIPFMLYLLIASVRDLRDALRRPAGIEEHVHHPVHEHEPVLVGAGAPVAEAESQLSVTCHEVRPVGSTTFRLAALAGFAMNFGMFWMSTGLLVPILPWMKLLAF